MASKFSRYWFLMIIGVKFLDSKIRTKLSGFQTLTLSPFLEGRGKKCHFFSAPFSIKWVSYILLLSRLNRGFLPKLDEDDCSRFIPKVDCRPPDAGPAVEKPPGAPKLRPAGPVKAPPAEKPAATALAAELAAVGVSRPPPTVELKPMKAPARGNRTMNSYQDVFWEKCRFLNELR